jgi:multidrug efflux system membrane fusion protein
MFKFTAWKPRKILPALGCAVLILATVMWHWQGRAAGGTPSSAASPAPAPVDIAAASRADVPVYLEGLGTVQAFNTVTMKTRVDGQIQKVSFVEGKHVKAGDLLVQIDPRPYQAAYDQVVAKKAQDEAQLANAKVDLERYAALLKTSAAPRQQADTQRALVAQLEATVRADQGAIDAAKVQLDYTGITSPIDGITGIRLVDQGNIVHAADPGGLVVVTQLHPISVIFTLSETFLPAINRALAAGPLKVEAWSQDDGEKLDEGVVALVDNQIDPATGTMKVKATFPNEADTLWPGQFVNAHLQVETRHDGITVPVQAIQRGPKGTFAWVIKQDDKTAEMRPITVGYTTSDTALIDRGLSPGDLVVTDGQYKLVVGSKVEVTMRNPKQTAAMPGPAP